MQIHFQKLSINCRRNVKFNSIVTSCNGLYVPVDKQVLLHSPDIIKVNERKKIYKNCGTSNYQALNLPVLTHLGLDEAGCLHKEVSFGPTRVFLRVGLETVQFEGAAELLARAGLVDAVPGEFLVQGSSTVFELVLFDQKVDSLLGAGVFVLGMSRHHPKNQIGGINIRFERTSDGILTPVHVILLTEHTRTTHVSQRKPGNLKGLVIRKSFV